MRLWSGRAFVAGHGPLQPDGSLIATLGKVGAEVNEEQAYVAARAICASDPLGWIGWSGQVPARRAAERDEAAVAAWRQETWPVIKGRPRSRAPGWSSRTSPARV